MHIISNLIEWYISNKYTILSSSVFPSNLGYIEYSEEFNDYELFDQNENENDKNIIDSNDNDDRNNDDDNDDEDDKNDNDNNDNNDDNCNDIDNSSNNDDDGNGNGNGIDNQINIDIENKLVKPKMNLNGHINVTEKVWDLFRKTKMTRERERRRNRKRRIITFRISCDVIDYIIV